MTPTFWKLNCNFGRYEKRWGYTYMFLNMFPVENWTVYAEDIIKRCLICYYFFKLYCSISLADSTFCCEMSQICFCITCYHKYNFSDEQQHICDMIMGNESLVENFNSQFLAPLSRNFNMLHFDPNLITIGYLVTELWRICQC